MSRTHIAAKAAPILTALVALLLISGCDAGDPSALRLRFDQAAPVVQRPTSAAPTQAVTATKRVVASTATFVQAPTKVWTAAHEKKYRRGRIVASTRCNECHRRYAPHEYSPRDWTAVLPEMMRKAKLSRRDREAIRVYLEKASAKDLCKNN